MSIRSVHPNTTARIFLECLGCVNEGRLIGRWVDAVDALDITPQMLHGHDTDHEELWVTDHEGIPVRDEMDQATAAGWGNVLSQVEDNLEREALCAWVESGDYLVDGDTDYPSLMFFRDAYQGHWTDFDEFARQLSADMGLLDDVPEHIARYFDWSSWIDDLKFDYREEPTPVDRYGVFVFRAM